MDGQRGESLGDYYDILGVPVGATFDEIDAAYRREARRWHPDVNHSSHAGAHMRRLNEARGVLCDASRTGSFADVSVPPFAVAEPATVDFGAIRPICHHPAVTVRLDNRGGPAVSVSIEPEEGSFWAISEIRGGEAEGEVAQFDFEARGSAVGAGHHHDVVLLCLDDVEVAVDLLITVRPATRPEVTLTTAAVVALAAAAVVVVARGGASPVSLAFAALVFAAVFITGAVAGHAAQWPENWSTARAAAVWFDPGHSSPFTLRHHVPWPGEMLPASRRWTSACIQKFAEAAGVGPVKTTFSRRQFAASAGYKPHAPSRWHGPSGTCVFIPWTARFARGAAARTAAHQLGHLAWPPWRHDADFFRRVQALIDATPCPQCARRLRREP